MLPEHLPMPDFARYDAIVHERRTKMRDFTPKRHDILTNAPDFDAKSLGTGNETGSGSSKGEKSSVFAAFSCGFARKSRAFVFKSCAFVALSGKTCGIGHNRAAEELGEATRVLDYPLDKVPVSPPKKSHAASRRRGFFKGGVITRRPFLSAGCRRGRHASCSTGCSGRRPGYRGCWPG